MAYTLEDFVKLNPNYKKSYNPTTRQANVTNTKTGKSINFTSGQGQQYGLGDIERDSNVISDINKFTSYFNNANNNTSYESPYSRDIAKTLRTIQNNKSFSYDPSEDEGLQAAQESAMDAVSRAAARRGMLYSNSNKSQLGKSALALVPEFRQQAYNEYQAQNQDMYNTLSSLLNLENQAYGQYRDTLSDQRYTDETTYNRNLQQQQLQVEQEYKAAQQQQQQFENAVALSNQLGYVPNEAAIILGVPAMTPTFQAKEAIANRKAEIQLESQRAANAMAQIDARSEASMNRLITQQNYQSQQQQDEQSQENSVNDLYNTMYTAIDQGVAEDFLKKNRQTIINEYGANVYKDLQRIYNSTLSKEPSAFEQYYQQLLGNE